MTSIHAPIPPDYAIAAREAKYRGEDPGSISEEQEETHSLRTRKQPRLNTGTIIKPARRAPPTNQQHAQPPTDENMSDSENEDPASASKENNPSLSPTPVRHTPPSPRKGLGKRPLSVLSVPYPEDPDTEMMIIDTDEDQIQDHYHHPSSSEQNITANTRPNTRSRSQSPRKSPKRSSRRPALPPTPQTIAPFQLRDDLQIYEDVPDRTVSNFSRRFGSNEKSNQHAPSTGMACATKDLPLSSTMSTSVSHHVSAISAPGQSKVTKKVASTRKAVPKVKPRIGVRRL